MSRVTALLLVAPALLVAASGSAQDLRGRLRAAPSGDVTFHFDARPGVCGDGEVIVRERAESGRSVSYVGRNSNFNTADRDFDNLDSWCRPGPVRVLLTREAGVVTDIQLAVGPATFTATHDLGGVAAGEAVDVLVNDMARAGMKRVASRAIHGASMAAAPAWQELLALARDSTIVSDVRRNARQWIAIEAADHILERTPALDADAEVRRHVVFALSRRKDERSRTALWEMAESGADPAVRAAAVFWLGQSEDPRALRLLESVLR
jgi:hypothetical protein